jgi:hypothetical protein
MNDLATYPVPGRDPLFNERVAAHEAGHCLASRLVGSNIHSVTICPDADRGFEGRCRRSGPPSPLSLNLDAVTSCLDNETVEIIEICALLEKLTPEIGSGRVESSEFITRATTNAIELVAGEAAELLLYPNLAPLGAVHDHTDARAFAGVAVASSAAVPALLAYAQAEAAGLLLANIGILRALAAALAATGTLDGDEVDRIISETLAAEALAIERRRRDDWQRRQASAARFADREH